MQYLRVAAILASLTFAAQEDGFGQTVQNPDSATQESQQSKRPARPQFAPIGNPDPKPEPKQDPKDEGWKQLLPAKGLEGWQVTDFGGNGKVKRDGPLLVLAMGDPLNGINTRKKDFPKNDFEISLEAKRVEGSDFLCGLTFPVGKEFCSFIAGGWGGGLVGLSNVDGYDASENATTTYSDFQNGKWYRFKVRVDDEYVRAWIDDKEFFRQEREGHEFSTRIEVYASQPLGFCAFQSKVTVRDFKWRPIGKKSMTKPETKNPKTKVKEAPKPKTAPVTSPEVD